MQTFKEPKTGGEVKGKPFEKAKDAIERKSSPFSQGCHIKYSGTTAELRRDGHVLKCEIPRHSGWYELDENGLPFGKPSKKDNPEAAYFRRVAHVNGWMDRTERLFDAACTSYAYAIFRATTGRMGFTNMVEITDYAYNLGRKEATEHFLYLLQERLKSEQMHGKWFKVIRLSAYLALLSYLREDLKVEGW